MKNSPLVLALAIGMLMADPAMAQNRDKDSSRRTTPRGPIVGDADERRRERTSDTAARRPIRINVNANRPRTDDRDRERRLYYERHRMDTRSRVIVVAPGVVHRDYGYRYGTGYGYGAGRVWNRPGMTCQRLDDELEWAHDEWHYRHDRQSDEAWYHAEHALLERRIAEERAYAGCARREHRDCHERGHYPQTGTALDVALFVLDVLLRDGNDRRGYRAP